MKRILLFLFTIVSLQMFSQPLGNEWVSYTQKYYKIAVVSKGIHRVTFPDLVAAGVPTGEIDPFYLQLFSKGQEQYIYVSGAADRVFNANDYIEFYGEPNTGWLDTVFYNDASQQVNPNYSMINDTSWYFLTWNTSGVTTGVPKRFIEENDQSFNSYTASDYCMKTVRNDYVSNYNSTNEGAYYNDGEGWIDAPFDYSTTSSKTIATPNFINKAVKSTISFCLVGANGTGHHLRVTGLNIILDTTFYGYKTINASYQILNPLTASSVLNAKSLTGSTDNNAWAWASITYSHSMDFENTTSFAFRLPTTLASKYRLDITNFNGDTATVFYDLTNHKRIRPINNLGTFQLLLTNGSNAPQCIISSGADIKKSVSIKAISSQNADLAYFSDFRILKAGFIIVTNKALWTKAKEYADYRKSKGYNVVLLDVDELYNQFAYGINKHPAAIRNFCRYALKYSSVKPEFLFLIGKSLHSNTYRKVATLYGTCLVPSAGMPVSDVLFSWKLGKGYSPIIATGRIAATSLTDVDWYLNKVKDYELCQPAGWWKNVLQFSGGNDISEQSMMKNYVLNYGRIFEDTLFGAITQNFYKNSSLPIGNTQTDIIRQSINSGVSVLNFFGHASGTGFDQDINLPSTYDNKGKYPFLMANSCYSGDINNSGTKGISEQWVLIKDKGTIGFLANVDLGYSYYLNLFSEELVKNISYKNYQGAIGKSILNAISANEKRDSSNDYMRFTSLDMVLHGDPAIKIYGFSKPDLVANVNDISFKPLRLTTDIDSFQVNYAMVNQGRAFLDSFQVQVKRIFPNGKTVITNYKVKGVRSVDTLVFKLPLGGLPGTGINTIQITLDINDSIVESNEANNSVTYSFVVNSTDLLPVYPYKYAIYPNDTVEFIACSPDPYIGNKTAKCQLDISAKFDSPSLISASSQYDNALFKWKLPIKFIANQVYYWRVAIDNGTGILKWNTSSFIYIPGKTGWSQAEFHQFNEDDYQYLSWNEPNNNFSFIQAPKRLFCQTIGTKGVYNASQASITQFTLDGSMQSWSSCGISPAFNVVIFDSATINPWLANKAFYGQSNYPVCNGIINNMFVFTSNDATSRTKMGTFISDSVPNGNYILIYTWLTGNFASMEESVIQKFESLGAKRIRSLVQTSQNHIPYIFFVKKGRPETVSEVVGSDPFSEIKLDTVDLHSNYFQGNVNSTIIGPSKHWSRFVKNMPAIDSFDVNRFTITAINQKSQEYQALRQLQTNVDTLGNAINASLYPYMRLSMSTSDNVLRTPGQLKAWQVFYDEYPDGAVTLSPQSKFYSDTLQEGDNMKITLSFKNISSYPLDSVMVTYTITNDKNALIQLITKKLKPLAAGEMLSDSILFSTITHLGTNLVTVEFNPFNPAKGTYDQLEQYHFNNLAQRYFHVIKDKRNPLFDVTFDGIHIMNGDIVSAKPEIKISMKDENKFFILDDTSLVKVYLKSMTDNKERQLQFSSNGSAGELTFIPGTSKNNKASMSFNPVFSNDGMYQIRINGKDKSGNQSGGSDYVISFEIITKSSITNLINYPNPFTTATRFVFTLTGSEIPSDLRIQIFTITGKMVKEISLAELGSLHIGRNITQFAWDGTDAFGDKLANGVYLYRVFSSIKGTAIDHRGADIDQYFKKGFGKMYLMR